MNTINNKRRKQSREKIINTFIKLMEENEFEDITVAKICLKAHINRSTFYSNFEDIFELSRAFEIKALSDFETLHNEEDPSEYLKNLLVYVKENKLFYKTYSKLHIKKHITNTLKICKNKNDLYGKYSDYFFASGISSVIEYWIENDCDLPINELHEIISFI